MKVKKQASLFDSRIMIMMVFLFFIIACSKEKTVTTKIEAVEILQFLPTELEENQIWFELDEDGYLTVFEKDMRFLGDVIGEIMERILPQGRSFSPEDPKSIGCIQEYFKEKGMKSSLKFVDGAYWVIIEDGKFDEHLMITSICMTIEDHIAYPPN